MNVLAKNLRAAALVALLGGPAALAPAQAAPTPSTPAGPTPALAATAEGASAPLSLTLARAIELALANNPDRASAQLGEEIAQIDARRARLDRFTAQVTANAAGDVGVAKPWKEDAYTAADASWDGHATVAVPIWAGGAYRAAIDAADAGSDIARLDRELTERSLVRATYTAYWNIKGYELQIEAAQEGLDLTQQALDIIVAKADAGLAAGIDVNRSRVDLYAQQEALVEEKAAMAQAQEELLRLLHLGSTELTLTDAPPTPSADPVQVDETRLASRPELQREALQARQAQDGVTSALAAGLPQIGLTGTAGASASGVGVTDTPIVGDDLGPDLDASVGVQLSWNPFDLWKVRDAAAQARLRVQQADASREGESAQLAADLRQAATQVAQLRARAPLVDAQVALARDNLQIVQGLYGQGSASILELFNAQAAFRSARTQGAGLRVQLATAECDLLWLLGDDVTSTSGTP